MTFESATTSSLRTSRARRRNSVATKTTPSRKKSSFATRNSWSVGPRSVDPSWQPLRALLREAPPADDSGADVPFLGTPPLRSPGLSNALGSPLLPSGGGGPALEG